MKIGIYGGSFDPVHNDHLSICLKFKNLLALDKVIVFPAYQSPFKSGHFTAGEHRKNMLEIAFKEYPFIEVSDFELKSEGKSYTYLTVEHLKESYSNNELYLLIGYDSLKGFLNWKRVDYLLASVTLVVADRGGCDFEEELRRFKKACGYTFIPMQNEGTVSSTYVREQLKLGICSQEFLPISVCDYIKSNSLYMADELYLKVQKRLKPSRLFHTAGVVATAVSYAKRLGENADNARIAALLHDIAKYEAATNYPECEIPVGAPESVKHQYIGAYIANKEFGIDNQDVLNAIRYHTTGRPDMSTLEKIVFIADLLEPSRRYGEVDYLRAEVERDFENGFKLCVKRLIEYLKISASDIFYLTTLTNEYYNSKK
ncbi:MAG: nicotinate (nicotinamide) nucleotide adenylyltransferase [Clostridiales bacterium]|nr:nicotinate (nicotinamide) nucleotide adenylyltransferase [Clostridiales bacterium]